MVITSLRARYPTAYTVVLGQGVSAVCWGAWLYTRVQGV